MTTHSSLTGGVRLSSATPDALRAAGWHVGVLESPRTKAEALEGLGRALAVPRWYGRNLDALADCLGDLARPTALVWRGWESLAIDASDDWADVLRVLRERAAQQPGFLVVLAHG